MSIDYEADAGAKPAMSAAEVIKAVTDMVQTRDSVAAKLAAAELEVKKEREALQRIERVDIPEMMRAAGLEKLKTATGTTVELKEDIDCGISEERREAAHAWLRKMGLGAVIKCLVGVSFGKGQEAEAAGLLDDLESRFGEDAFSKENVHPQTLKALLREQLEKGNLVDTEVRALFALTPYTVAKCKEAKK